MSEYLVTPRRTDIGLEFFALAVGTPKSPAVLESPCRKGLREREREREMTLLADLDLCV